MLGTDLLLFFPCVGSSLLADSRASLPRTSGERVASAGLAGLEDSARAGSLVFREGGGSHSISNSLVGDTGEGAGAASCFTGSGFFVDSPNPKSRERLSHELRLVGTGSAGGNTLSGAEVFGTLWASC